VSFPCINRHVYIQLYVHPCACPCGMSMHACWTRVRSHEGSTQPQATTPGSRRITQHKQRRQANGLNRPSRLQQKKHPTTCCVPHMRVTVCVGRSPSTVQGGPSIPPVLKDQETNKWHSNPQAGRVHLLQYKRSKQEEHGTRRTTRACLDPEAADSFVWIQNLRTLHALDGTR
jgi:hypothetical protein